MERMLTTIAAVIAAIVALALPAGYFLTCLLYTSDAADE